MTTGKKILIVDIDFETLETLSCHFKNRGYEVFISTNGEDGLNKTREFNPDAIILEIVMPEMNGLQMCKKIKRDKTLKKIPVLFLTANSDEYLALSAHHVGGDHYLTKPVKTNLIFSIVEELLQEKEVDAVV